MEFHTLLKVWRFTRDRLTGENQWVKRIWSKLAFNIIQGGENSDPLVLRKISLLEQWAFELAQVFKVASNCHQSLKKHYMKSNRFINCVQILLMFFVITACSSTYGFGNKLFSCQFSLINLMEENKYSNKNVSFKLYTFAEATQYARKNYLHQQFRKLFSRRG